MQAYIKEILPIKVEWTDSMCLAVFFSGSNFNSGWLPNKNINTINNEEFAKDIKDIKKEIEILSTQSNTLILTGGEPCLQRQVLFAIIQMIKEKGMKIGLETNGTKPRILQQLLEENLLDFLVIHLNSSFNPELFEKITRSKSFFITSEIIIAEVKLTLQLLKDLNVTIPLEIQTTIIPSLLYRKEDLEQIAEIIKDIPCIWKLKKFDNSVVLVDKKFQNINPPSDQFLEDIKEHCLRLYPQMRIEIMQEVQQPTNEIN